MTTLLVLSDSGTPTGYGRIADEMLIRLTKRGISVHAASLGYDGLLPPQLDGQPLPYWVSSLGGRPYHEEFLKLLTALQPDVVAVIQDAPYIMTVRGSPYDWSQTAFIGITPVDGVPIYPPWLQTSRQADAWLSISQFGVEAFKKAGTSAKLCRPGVDGNTFYRKSPEERAALRAKLGLEPSSFVVGTMAMNQGRKAISQMLRAFFAWSPDKPAARYLLDMEAVSPAGWDIPALCEQYHWDQSRLIFRSEAQRAGLTKLAERYNVLDAHMVISHREGYGMPLAEAMACGVPTMAMDYCSGPEIVGEGRGILIPCLPYTEPGTWGGAEDHFADERAIVQALERLYSDPAYREQVGRAGMDWARQQTWDNPTDAFYEAIVQVDTAAKARRQTAKEPSP